MPDGWLQATVTRLPPALPQHGVVLSPVKLWVLAMLAPERGCAWLRSHRYAANLTGLAPTAQKMPGRDERTVALNKQTNICLKASALADRGVRPIH